MATAHKQGQIQNFKLGGALKIIAKILGVFRVNKSRFYAKKIIFFPILGGAPGAPPLDPP